MLERRTVLDDRWRVRRLVGRGTFAEIYEAADLRSEKGPDGRRRTVAVKVALDAARAGMLRHEALATPRPYPAQAARAHVPNGSSARAAGGLGGWLRTAHTRRGAGDGAARPAGPLRLRGAHRAGTRRRHRRRPRALSCDAAARREPVRGASSPSPFALRLTPLLCSPPRLPSPPSPPPPSPPPPSPRQLRKSAPRRRLSLRTVASAGVQMVDAIRTMHEMGWVHRDIKPSNFCVGLGAAMCPASSEAAARGV